MSEKEVWAAPDILFDIFWSPKKISGVTRALSLDIFSDVFTHNPKKLFGTPHQFTVFVDSKFHPNSKQFTHPNKNLIPLFGQHRFSN